MSVDLIINPYVPFSNFRYRVNQYGEIVDKNNQKLPLVHHENSLCVELDWIHGKKLYNAAIVVIVSFRLKMGLPHNLYEEIIPLYRNANSQDLTPKNLTYKFNPNGVSIDHRLYSGFYYIPEYTYYGINRNGHILNIYKNSVYIPKIGDNGEKIRYFTTSVVSDQGAPSHPGIHRLLALTFIDHDEVFENQDVNHMDGNTFNNGIKNLEWISHQENMIHALETGLRPDNKSIIAKNYITGEEKRYRSIQYFCQQFEIGKIYGRKSLEIGFFKITPNQKDHYYVRYENENWKVLSHSEIEIITCKKDSTEVPIKALNVFTQQLLIFKNLKQASKELSIDHRSIGRHIERSTTIPTSQYYFKELEDSSPFPKLNSDQLEVLKYNLQKERVATDAKISMGFKIIDQTTSNTTWYYDVDEVSKLLNLNRVTIYKNLRENNYDYIFGDRYRVEGIRVVGSI